MSEPIRILQVFAQMNRGGAENMIMNLYRNIDRSKVQFDFIVHTHDECALDKEIEQLGGKIYRVPKYNGKNHFAYKKAWSNFFLNHPEHKIVHAHVRSTASIYLTIAKKYGRKTIAHSHSTSSRGEWYSRIIKRLLQFKIRFVSDEFFACSKDAGEWLFGKKKTELNNFHLVKNAINTEKFKFDDNLRKEIRSRHKIHGEFVVGHVGNFNKAKNHSFILDVFHEIVKVNEKSILILIGDGPLQESMSDKARQLGIANNVIMVGNVENVSDYYNAMDIFLFPSIYEGLGMAAIEAQTNGLNCVVSDTLPEEIFITENIKSFPLKKSAKEWATLILNIYNSHNSRSDKDVEIHNKIENNGYGEKDVATWIENFYLEKYKTKVLYWGMSNNLGGIETYLWNIVKNNKSNYQIDFLTTSKEICFESEIRDYGSCIYKIPNRRPNPLIFYTELFRFFNEVKEHSIVHFFLQSCSSIEPVIVAKLFGRKVIVDSRSSYKGNKRLTRMLDSINKKLLPFFVDERLAISQDSGITMFRKKNFKIVNSAIDSERYKFNNTTRNKYREELGLKDEIIVGHVGRFTYEKNHAFLLEVFLNIISKNKNFKLVLVGDGPYKLDIIQKVKSLELENKVIFLGLRDDIPEILQMMDIFVFPSHFEGLGRVVIESQAAGLLTFVSDTVPNEVYITDIVKRISLDEPAEIWANEILKTINNKGSYQRTDKIDCVIKNGFDIRNTIDILISIYEKLVFHSRKGE